VIYRSNILLLMDSVIGTVNAYANQKSINIQRTWVSV